MNPHPFVLQPILKERVWGGRRLARLGRSLPAETPIGESWEVADLPERIPEGRSRIANGPLAGHTLREAIETQRSLVMGDAALTAEGGFPLLVKYLDAAENLSVQVHPTAEYARRHPGADVKNEAWVVLDAEPGAVIYAGLRPGLDAATFSDHARSGAVVDDLVAVPAQPGACHYLASGTCHALGAGVLVAEVQTPSDTTFRVYDWGRRGRELHLEQAIACIDFDVSDGEGHPAPEPIHGGRLRTTPLLDTADFGLEHIEATGTTTLTEVTSNRPLIWLVTHGTGRLEGGGHVIDLRAGVTVLLPAALDDAVATLDEGCRLLRVATPSPTRGLLAERPGV